MPTTDVDWAVAKDLDCDIVQKLTGGDTWLRPKGADASVLFRVPLFVWDKMKEYKKALDTKCINCE